MLFQKKSKWLKAYEKHELRMWITNVILPAIAAAGVAMQNPAIRNFVYSIGCTIKKKAKEIIEKIKTKLSKRKEEPIIIMVDDK